LLESSAAIRNTPWASLTNAPLLNGANFEVTLPTSGEMQFYRLKEAPPQAGSVSRLLRNE
jgi:hypothetical protein